MNKFKKDQIIVSEKEQRTSCGMHVQSYCGEINKVYSPEKDFLNFILVFRNKDKEINFDSHRVQEKHFRAATEAEEAAYYEGIRNINQMTCI